MFGLNIEELLKKTSEIVEREKTQQEEKRKRGENFNIFNVLNLSTKEVRLHSAFLAELLSPNGSHGLGDKFLKVFIEKIILKLNKHESFTFDTKSAKVHKEYYIGEVSQYYDKGGRIDLFIQDENNQTIVIENKINANDEELQLFRYNRYLTEELELTDQQYCLLYLTLDGRPPTEISTGKHIFTYDCISYKNDNGILSWLKQCLSIAALFPRVRETIVQYITNLEQITNTNIMNEENKNELIELLKKNMSAAVSVLEVEEEIKREVRRNYINQVIRKIAEKNSFEIVNDDDLNDFLDMKKDSVVILKPKEKIKSYDFSSFVLCVYAEKSARCVNYGISVNDSYKDKKVEQVWSSEKQNYPFGCQFIDEGQPQGFSYWNHTITIAQMQKEIEMSKNIEDYPKGTIAEEIENALKIVNEKSLFNKLYEKCKE